MLGITSETTVEDIDKYFLAQYDDLGEARTWGDAKKIVELSIRKASALKLMIQNQQVQILTLSNQLEDCRKEQSVLKSSGKMMMDAVESQSQVSGELKLPEGVEEVEGVVS